MLHHVISFIKKHATEPIAVAAGMAAGAAVGGGCEVLSAGALTPLCVVVGAAVGGAVGKAVDDSLGPEHVSPGDMLKHAVVAGAVGAAFGAAGAAVGAAAGSLGGRVATSVSRSHENVVSGTTARLAEHVRKAVADCEGNVINMSPKQAARASINPGLEPAFRGQVIDRAVKRTVANDPNLSHLWIARQGEPGPDFIDLHAGTWWDVTTSGQFQNHLDNCLSFGNGIGIYTQ